MQLSKRRQVRDSAYRKVQTLQERYVRLSQLSPPGDPRLDHTRRQLVAAKGELRRTLQE